MAYLTIIAQTFGFEDSYGYFTAALLKSSKSLLCYEINGVKFKKHRFDRVVITKDGGIIFLPPVIKHYRNKNIYEIDQWMGAGKSVVGMEHLGRVHARGGTIMANMAIGYMPHNVGKPKDQWTPNIQNLDDLKSVNNCTILIDDFKKIVQRWQCSEAVFIGMVANESRKDKKDILITAQRVVNFIPKDIREVCTNYEIPYVTIRDQRVESPDGMGMPVEIEVFNVSATGSFLGFGIWNGFEPDGKTLLPKKTMLDMYDTKEKVTDLKGEGANPNKPGYVLECKAKAFLESRWAEVEIKHLQKKIFDLYTPTHVFDVIGKDEDGNGYTEHKTWAKHLGAARRTGKIPYLMFEWRDSWGFIRIKSDLPEGQRLNFSDSSIYNRIRTLDTITMGANTPQSVPIPQIVSST